MKTSKGFTLIEVLITFIIVAIGLLGFMAYQVNAMNQAVETYQRGQVMNELISMANRIRLNAPAAYRGEYLDNSINFGKIPLEACGNLPTIAKRDLCEFNNILYSGNQFTQAEFVPAGTLSCIRELPSGQPGDLRVFRIEIVWPGQAQGVTSIAIPCGEDEIDEEYRRGLFRDVAVRNYDKEIGEA